MPDSSASRGMPRSLAILAATAFVGLLALMAYDHYSESVSRSGPKVAPAVVPKPLAQTAESAPPAVAPTEPSPPSAAPPAERASSVPSQPGEPAMLQPAAGIAQAQPAPVQAAPASKPAEPGVHRLSFQFGRDSWVEVKDAEGKVLMSRTLPAGTSQVIEGRAPLSLVIGNAQHVELMLDDQPVDLVPHTGQSVARLKLP